jgi:hypothetical protein
MSFGVLYDDTNFNLSLPAVLGSNLNGSTALSPTFPTTSTGTSLGHYHYTEDTTNSLKFLNASGTGNGGHQFWHSSSTQAPIKVFETNSTETIINTQFNVDKSVAGTPILIDLPNLTQSTNVVVVFASPINQPPWNIVGVGNPIQVNQNTANMVVGTTYYLTGFSPQLGQVTTNADGTGVIDCTDLVNLPQPILTWESGQFNPSTIQTAILSDNLTITTDTDISVLSSTDLTFGGTSILSTIANLTILQKSVFNQYISTAIYADGRPPTAPSTTIAQQYAYTPSWYFKNTTAGYKINWYIGATNGMVVSDILGLYIAFFNGNNTSNDNAPFITIYTTATGVNDYAPGFYHSACTYVFDGSITANTRYLEFLNLHSCPIPNFYGATLRYMIQSPVAPNPRGTFLQTESVAFFSIGSNSASAVNTTEFAISKFGIMRASGTSEVNFFQN